MTAKGRNAKTLINLLKNRDHMVGAEIGVFEGDTSCGLLQGLPKLKKLFCIDIWVEDEEFKAASPNKRGRIYNADWQRVKEIFCSQVAEIYSHRILPLQMTSTEAVGLLNDGELDFVFIDANHSYKRVLEDIEVWFPKVREGGFISGDDFTNKPSYGVMAAVREAFGDNFRTAGKIWYTIKEGL